MIGRRSFLSGLAALMAAPAVCRADSLMALRGEIVASTRLFRTVTLNGLMADDLILLGEDVLSPYAETLNVPWLGSVERSMNWYTTKLLDLKSKFSRVNSIEWVEHMPQLERGFQIEKAKYAEQFKDCHVGSVTISPEDGIKPWSERFVEPALFQTAPYSYNNGS